MCSDDIRACASEEALPSAPREKDLDPRDEARMNYMQKLASVKPEIRLTLRLHACWLISIRIAD